MAPAGWVGRTAVGEGTFKDETADALRTNNPESGEWCQKGLGRSTLAQQLRLFTVLCDWKFLYNWAILPVSEGLWKSNFRVAFHSRNSRNIPAANSSMHIHHRVKILSFICIFLRLEQHRKSWKCTNIFYLFYKTVHLSFPMYFSPPCTWRHHWQCKYAVIWDLKFSVEDLRVLFSHHQAVVIGFGWLVGIPLTGRNALRAWVRYAACFCRSWTAASLVQTHFWTISPFQKLRRWRVSKISPKILKRLLVTKLSQKAEPLCSQQWFDAIYFVAYIVARKLRSFSLRSCIFLVSPFY